MIVAKFGGSSVRNGEAMLFSSSVIENQSEIGFSIISATYQTTNQLEQLVKLAIASPSFDQVLLELNTLHLKHKNIAEELYSSREVYSFINAEFEQLQASLQIIFEERKCSPAMMDRVYAVGELVASFIFFDLLKLRLPDREVEFLDARELMITNADFNKAQPLLEEIKARVDLKIVKGCPQKLYVTQGFIGKTPEGETTTLGREGSDYSAALFGEALDASEIQIWTDVEGVFNFDPRVVTNASVIRKLNYKQATLLAENGAKVLFERTLDPALRKNIPVFVGNSKKPHAGGTIISSLTLREYDSTKKPPMVLGMAALKNEYQWIVTFVFSQDAKTINIQERKNQFAAKFIQHPKMLVHKCQIYFSDETVFKVINEKEVIDSRNVEHAWNQLPEQFLIDCFQVMEELNASSLFLSESN